jgi:hypothetical protein
MTRPADRVALVLAAALVVAVVGLFAAVLANIVSNHQPAATLGENTTQVLSGLIGGIVGVLGAYLGRVARRREDDDQ